VESAIRNSEPAQHYHGPTLVHTIAASAVDTIVCAKVGITPVCGDLLVELAVREGLRPFLRDASEDLRLPEYSECSATGTKFVVVGDDTTTVYVL
jgi:hypothetical protein